MKKKKIKKEDLELNYEVMGLDGNKNTRKATDACGGATNNTCTTVWPGTCPTVNPALCPTLSAPPNCDTTTTSVADCKTAANPDGCNPDSYVCVSRACSEEVCVDSNSMAPICCPFTNAANCNNTVDNCATNVACIDSKNICLESQNNPCLESQNNPCLLSQDNTCLCLLSQDGDCYTTPYTTADNCPSEVTDNCFVSFEFTCNTP